MQGVRGLFGLLLSRLGFAFGRLAYRAVRLVPTLPCFDLPFCRETRVCRPVVIAVYRRDGDVDVRLVAKSDLDRQVLEEARLLIYVEDVAHCPDNLIPESDRKRLRAFVENLCRKYKIVIVDRHGIVDMFTVDVPMVTLTRRDLGTCTDEDHCRQLIAKNAGALIRKVVEDLIPEDQRDKWFIATDCVVTKKSGPAGTVNRAKCSIVAIYRPVLVDIARKVTKIVKFNLMGLQPGGRQAKNSYMVEEARPIVREILMCLGEIASGKRECTVNIEYRGEKAKLTMKVEKRLQEKPRYYLLKAEVEGKIRRTLTLDVYFSKKKIPVENPSEIVDLSETVKERRRWKKAAARVLSMESESLITYAVQCTKNGKVYLRYATMPRGKFRLLVETIRGALTGRCTGIIIIEPYVDLINEVARRLTAVPAFAPAQIRSGLVYTIRDGEAVPVVNYQYLYPLIPLYFTVSLYTALTAALERQVGLQSELAPERSVELTKEEVRTLLAHLLLYAVTHADLRGEVAIYYSIGGRVNIVVAENPREIKSARHMPVAEETDKVLIHARTVKRGGKQEKQKVTVDLTVTHGKKTCNVEVTIIKSLVEKWYKLSTFSRLGVGYVPGLQNAVRAYEYYALPTDIEIPVEDLDRVIYVPRVTKINEIEKLNIINANYSYCIMYREEAEKILELAARIGQEA